MPRLFRKITIIAVAILIALGDMGSLSRSAGQGEARADDRVLFAQAQLTRLERLQRLRRAALRQRMIERRLGRTIAERRAAARQRFARSRTGAAILRGEIVAISPDRPTLERVQEMGFKIGRSIHLRRVGLELVVLRAPDKMDTAEALDQLRAGLPDAAFEFNHVFNPAGMVVTSGTPVPSEAQVPWPDLEPIKDLRLGLVDLGVDTGHPSLKGLEIHTAVFTGEKEASPSTHGTAVASLLVGEGEGFHGAARGAELFAADVFGDADTGGSVLAIVQALIWLADQETPVIAMPLVGPPNRILELTLARLEADGILVVAPVGNEGPAQPVAYPAAYPGVVAVTATDWDGKVFISANRGGEVMFSAVGVEIPAAADPELLVTVSGTSFAVPEVAARLLRQTMTPDPLVADRALESLQLTVTDLGDPGRDDVYGYGLVSRISLAESEPATD